MASARDTFLAQIRTPDLDPDVFRLRGTITQLKQETLQQVAAMEPERAGLVMPTLFEQLVQLEVQLAAHVGLGVALAVTVFDDHHSGASLSGFDRELRDQMSEIAGELSSRHASRLATIVAQIETQRLAWRHSHEFMSWLAFRRGDDRYPAADRLERVHAFGVQERLLEARKVVVSWLGVRLSTAIESSDRFLLGNRWRLIDTPEHALERYVWPLLSYQPASTVRLERARWEYDCMVEERASPEPLEAEQTKLADLLEAQLVDSLTEAPSNALSGTFQGPTA